MDGLTSFYDNNTDPWIISWWLHDDLVPEMADMATSNRLTKLDPLSCVETYYELYLSKFRNVLLVTDDSSFNKTAAVPYRGDRGISDGPCGAIQEFQWICEQYQHPRRTEYGDDCETHCELLRDTVINNITNWRPTGNSIKYCLAQPSEEHCKLRFTPVIAGIVILLNLTKGITLLYLALSSTKDPLLTLGDAISSFLKCPDSQTDDMCLVSKAEIVDQPTLWSKGARTFSPEPKRRFAVMATKFWLLCFSS
jgi:hypothetical protein